VRQLCEHRRNVAYTTVFEDRLAFEHFLDLDDLRFQYVPMFADLRRAFLELISPDA
jgi:hypothetical protein